ncbi:exo-beta-N-acetylmuramidase NamZ family protein [Psychroflexus planctonicus]|uniref:exo-beta-N-acetylmuramidase NamZ family protein n=1 Tax=Psychroflexus planctonicus TaxID=1526575 RepID=UPI001665065A|nr:DUF1343 domain-containing protein [Psychroflexus planctonicus]
MKTFYLWFKNTFLFFLLACISCNSVSQNSPKLGIEQTKAYLPLLKDKKVAVVGNQTSVVLNKNGEFVHLVDTLLASQISVSKVFAPEHGFRGKADAGESITDGIDSKTGLPIISLYGNNKKPTPVQLQNIDVLVFDIQDVGARFYTYISTLHYVMEACAENNVDVVVLDRPNPNGNYIDGPILEPEFSSFVGMHPIPVVHGLSMGEYARMINGEGFLKNKMQAKLWVISMKNYNKEDTYQLPIKPSPNLPNAKSINLYPSLCFFEGTNVNAGRGTDLQFQVFGSPYLDAAIFPFEYTPQSTEGAKSPKHLGKLCYGEKLTDAKNLNRLELKWLIKAYQNTANKEKFFNNFFNKLAGNATLQEAIQAGKSAEEIRATWQEGLAKYRKQIEPYLLYSN